MSATIDVPAPITVGAPRVSAAPAAPAAPASPQPTPPACARHLVELLDVDDRTARWLVAVGCGFTAGAGDVLGHRRFAHVVLDGPDAGLVVDAGTTPHRLTEPTRVLVLGKRHAARLRRRRMHSPALQDAALAWVKVPYYL